MDDEDTLELDLPPLEEARASVPIEPGPANDSTLALTEAPLPSGAYINADGGLEPLLAVFSEAAEGERGKALPPPFLSRLAGGGDGKAAEIKVVKEAPLTWSLSRGDAWPVFVRRLVFTGPLRAKALKEAALAAKRYAANRLALSPQGDLDLFFNDRHSLTKAAEDLGTLGSELPGIPALIRSCRGLLCCPHAAVDSLSLAASLGERLKKTRLKADASLPEISIYGCPAAGGLDCGTPTFTDFRIIGMRDNPPLMDAELLKFSPRLDTLVAECPGKALKAAPDGGAPLELDEKACQRCGLCLSLDPSFYWPSPQGSYLRLELSGRRKRLGKDAFLKPLVLKERADGDGKELFRRLGDFIGLWRRDKLPGELIADFAKRRSLHGFFHDLG
jgi:dissimilatory sulfite reductase (desulfoviridin) alpha/beta subunit